MACLDNGIFIRLHIEDSWGNPAKTIAFRVKIE